MTSPLTPTTAGLRDQLAGLARGNLAALLAGQGMEFPRLVHEMDRVAGRLGQDVLIQLGTFEYRPQHARAGSRSPNPDSRPSAALCRFGSSFVSLSLVPCP